MARPRFLVPLLPLALGFSILALDVEILVQAFRHGRASGWLLAYVFGFGACMAASNVSAYRFFRVSAAMSTANREGRSSDSRRLIRPLLMHVAGAGLPLLGVLLFLTAH